MCCFRTWELIVGFTGVIVVTPSGHMNLVCVPSFDCPFPFSNLFWHICVFYPFLIELEDLISLRIYTLHKFPLNSKCLDTTENSLTKSKQVKAWHNHILLHLQ